MTGVPPHSLPLSLADQAHESGQGFSPSDLGRDCVLHAVQPSSGAVNVGDVRHVVPHR